MILVCDVGTTVLKVGLAGPEGLLLARAEAPVRLSGREHPLHHEADANNWLSALGLGVAQLELPRAEKLTAVVVSGNGPTLVPVGRGIRPLDFAMTWMDRRGVEESRQVAEVTGRHVDPTFYLPKALWVRRNRPKLYERTRYFCTCPEFIDYFLTGVPVTVLPAEGFRPYFWTASVLTALGMDPEKFPPFVAPGQRIGAVRREAEELVGIPAGTPVFAGGPDFIMTVLGTGSVRPGLACDRAGTSEGINLCAERTVEDRRLLCLPHVVAGYHNISGIISTSGKALEWFRNLAEGPGESAPPTDYESLFEEVCQVPAGARSLLFLPYLAGERAPIWDPDARGCFIGLRVNHGRREMLRAVVESVAFAVRDVVEVMEEHRLEIQELRVTGGQARSPVWNQIKADVCQKPIVMLEQPDAELLGAACVGLFALGRQPDLASAAGSVVRVRRVYEPAVRLKGLYDELFGLYRACYEGLREVFPRLARVPREEES